MVTETDVITLVGHRTNQLLLNWIDMIITSIWAKEKENHMKQFHKQTSNTKWISHKIKSARLQRKKEITEPLVSINNQKWKPIIILEEAYKIVLSYINIYNLVWVSMSLFMLLFIFSIFVSTKLAHICTKITHFNVRVIFTVIFTHPFNFPFHMSMGMWKFHTQIVYENFIYPNCTLKNSLKSDFCEIC